MSSSIASKIGGSLRKQVVSGIKKAAKSDGVAVHADGLAFASHPDLMFVIAPVAGLEELDYRTIFKGHTVFDERPVMYWHLSGRALDRGKASIPAGFYTLVADQKSGRVRLLNRHGKPVAQGSLDTCIQTAPKTIAKMGVSAGIDSIHFGKHSIKICGHVEVSIGPATVTVSGCVETHN